mgnify:CR=1 FL=1
MEQRGLLLVTTEQFQQAIVMSLGLKYTPVLNAARLAYRTVNRAQPVTGVVVQLVGACFERTGKKSIKAFITEPVGNFGFLQVDAVQPGIDTNGEVLERFPAHTCNPEHAPRDCMVRQNIKWQ